MASVGTFFFDAHGADVEECFIFVGGHHRYRACVVVVERAAAAASFFFVLERESYDCFPRSGFKKRIVSQEVPNFFICSLSFPSGWQVCKGCMSVQYAESKFFASWLLLGNRVWKAPEHRSFTNGHKLCSRSTMTSLFPNLISAFVKVISVMSSPGKVCNSSYVPSNDSLYDNFECHDERTIQFYRSFYCR